MYSNKKKQKETEKTDARLEKKDRKLVLDKIVSVN